VFCLDATPLGPWQNEEIQALLSQFITRKCPVIQAILDTARTTPELPWMLANRQRVDFRSTELDPIDQLIGGSEGKNPTFFAKLSEFLEFMKLWVS
jgi:hypothetical protein